MPHAPDPAIRHVLIANAWPAAPLLRPGLPPPPPPQAPHLQALVRSLRVTDRLRLDSADPSQGLHTPLELLLAKAHGLPADAQGALPWAAFETATTAQPCAWMRPCHWQLGLDQVQVLPPSELNLSADDSRALMQTVQTLLAEDGVQLDWQRSDAWLAQGERLRTVRAPSIERASLQSLSPQALQRGSDPGQSAWLQRLMGELQMLLYEHPVNQAREAAGLWPINAIWIDGAGALDAPLPPASGVWVERRLDGLHAGDVAQRQQQWQAIDAELGHALRAALQAHQPVQLSLCGPQHAITLSSPRHLLERLRLPLRPLRWAALLETHEN